MFDHPSVFAVLERTDQTEIGDTVLVSYGFDDAREARTQFVES
jgi:hypothetical protein